MVDYTRDSSPCPKRRSVENEFGTPIRRGGHYSSAIKGAPFDHDWIYVGEGYVVDIPGDGFRVTKREMNPLGHVTEQKSPSQTALDSAENAIGKRWVYHQEYNNCQHFATWCSTGVFHSRAIVTHGITGMPKTLPTEYNNVELHYPGALMPTSVGSRFADYDKNKKMTRPNPF